jgi:hypothetical protein
MKSKLSSRYVFSLLVLIIGCFIPLIFGYYLYSDLLDFNTILKIAWFIPIAALFIILVSKIPPKYVKIARFIGVCIIIIYMVLILFWMTHY